MNPTVRALVLIAKQSLVRVRQLSAQLQSASHRDASPMNRALKSECDLLSGSLSKLARYYVDDLPAEQEEKQPSATDQDDSDLLYIVRLLDSAHQCGFCDCCGGVVTNE